MESKKLAAIVAVALVSITSAAYLYSAGGSDNSSLKAVLEDEGYALVSDQNFTVTDTSNRQVAGISVREVEASSGRSEVSLQIFSGVDRSFAENYMDDRRSEISAVYTDKPAPYEGIPKREIDCPDRFVPSLDENSTQEDRSSYVMYSDREGDIGACSNSTAYHRTRLELLYCSENQRFIDMKIDRPIEENEITVDISCKSLD